MRNWSSNNKRRCDLWSDHDINFYSVSIMRKQYKECRKIGCTWMNTAVLLGRIYPLKSCFVCLHRELRKQTLLRALVDQDSLCLFRGCTWACVRERKKETALRIFVLKKTPTNSRNINNMSKIHRRFYFWGSRIRSENNCILFVFYLLSLCVWLVQ